MLIAVKWNLMKGFMWHGLVMIHTATSKCILITDVLISGCRYQKRYIFEYNMPEIFRTKFFGEKMHVVFN
jgi:hypothetical protein